MTKTVNTASNPPTPWRCDFVVRGRFTSGRKRTTDQQHGVFENLETGTQSLLEESCPKRSPTQLPLAGFSRLAFRTIGKRIVFIGKTACWRPTAHFPKRGSAARHKTLCAIDQAHCEVQKAQSRVARPAAGDLRRADHGAFTTGKMAFRCDLRRAECLTQRASGESLGVIPPAKGAIAIGNRWPVSFVPAVAVARSGGGRRQRHELAGGQARRRSSALEGASPKRAAYSREKVERREKPQPVAIAATESSGLALSSRWRARSSR